MTAPSRSRLAQNPIAIIGVAGVFPQACDVREFWHNVVAGRDCITDVPAAHWSVPDHYDADMRAKDKTYARRGGFLPPVLFDPVEFAVPPSVVDSIGLVQLLSLRVAGEVLRDARCPESSWYDPSRTGVILGVCGQNTTMFPLSSRLRAPAVKRAALSCGVDERAAEEIARRFAEESPEWTEDSFPGVLANVVAGRIANRFDFGAANCTVDAACASSLAALRMAVSELVERRADLMITGGCDADNSVSTFLCFSKTPALSPSGSVRPFDSEADGTLLGEGIAMLAIKRLADAERDGDRVYAVLRGLGGSSDGRSGSIYAPNPKGQLSALRRAYADAEVAPETVQFVEAHGTGTRVGDTVELEALSTALTSGGKAASVAVGSVKSQIGHTKAAAGAAGLIKTALALHHRILPPTINVGAPNEAVRDTGLYINTRARPWLRDPRHGVRRGGVSSFGFGGVNYHAVLEEYQPAETELRTLHRTPRALLWHAPDPVALLALLREGAPAVTGRAVPPDHARLGLVARDPAERERLLAAAVDRLSDDTDAGAWTLEDRVRYRRSGLPPGTASAALFAGQGSQYPWMGVTALLDLPPVRRAFDAANALWEDEDTSLAHVVYPEPRYGDAPPGESLRNTAYAQAAVGALAMGQYTYLRELGFRPDAVLGHSSGEVTAVWAAGCLSDQDCLRVARARGRAMRPPPEVADPGAMAALRMPERQWSTWAERHGDLTLCNVNAPDEIVVGGPTAAVEALVAECLRDGGPAATRLPVAAAFHTSCVAHAVSPFADVLATAEFRPPACRVKADSPGARYGADPRENREVLARQIVRPVDFMARVRELYEEGVRVFVECGPGQILGRLVRRILPDESVEVIATDAGPGTDGAITLTSAALRLAVLGFDVRDINRYAAEPPPPPAAPSPVARTLEGPSFAVLARRDTYEARLRIPYRRATAEPSGRSAREVPTSAADEVPMSAADDGGTPVARDDSARLMRAAATQLELHSRFLSGQLETARSLAQALDRAGGAPDAALVTCVEAVRDHSRALFDTHVRSQEVILRMSRDGTDEETTAGADAAAADVLPRTRREVPVSLPRVANAQAALVPSAVLDASETLVDSDRAQPPASPAIEEDTAAEALTGISVDAGLDGAGVLPLDRSEIERALRELIAEKTGYTVEMVDPARDIQTELGIDSLKQVEIASEAWRRYPSLPREEIYRFAQARTVSELAELLTTKAPRTSGDAVPAHVPKGQASLGLRPLAAVDTLLGAYGDSPVAVLVEDGGPLANALADALAVRGWKVHRVITPGPDTTPTGARRLRDWREESLRAEIGHALSEGGRLDLCLLVEGRHTAADGDRAVTRLRHAVLVAKHTAPTLKEAVARGRRGAFVAVTQLDGALGLAGSHGRLGPALLGGLGGLTKALGVEEPDLFCRTVDIAPDSESGEAAEQVMDEINDVARVPEVAWDGARRRTPVLSRGVPPSGTPVNDPGQDDVLLVTGGARGITAWCVTALAAHHPCRFVLLGRTRLTGTPARAHEVHQRQELHETLDVLRKSGARVEYVAADIGDAEAVRTALAPYAGRITGVVHGAGVLADQPLSAKTPEDIERVATTKLTGLTNVLRHLEPERLRHLIVFTSVSGVYGNGRQTDYAMANEALNRFACAWKAAHPHTHVAALAWGPWRGGMATEDTQRFFQQLGVPLLSREEGCAYFVEQFSAPRQEDVVRVIGPLASVFSPAPVPPDGVVVRRDLTGLGAEPVLRDHTIAGQPVLPMTAAIGWCVFTVEETSPGRKVTEVHAFQVRKGLVLDDGHPEGARVSVRPRPDGRVAVAVHGDGTGLAPWYEGSFVTGPATDGVPRPASTSTTPPPAHDLHPAYDDGFLFHGPSLRGLGQVLQEDGTRLVVQALLPDPTVARGAYAGTEFSPALADLLLQAAALLGRRITGHRCLPVAVEKVELLRALPDGKPFVITVELHDHNLLELICTVTATEPDGTVLQRWIRLKGIVAAPQLGSRAAWPASAADV
ncbi:SDR family NAD(P)-dependent oxidoreductase [Streptomyces sp. PTM05]|uniref:SDR family NAD(P)-dependent oxidoreductase n=1 Tax=Streptantibioticus parmotrematis TaxID=2873249 RepID=A0ABS7QTV4_9ACTN|nr:type I polyketide synthase [Streptantibioticus parmotrematis]MBY8886114.1 SDR family NAD(P)-dependent oxidoreductase [Streptantibioticus parmotrematis]